MNTYVKPWMRWAGTVISTTYTTTFFALNLPAAFAQPSVIHVHESGGAAALTQALADVAEPDRDDAAERQEAALQPVPSSF